MILLGAFISGVFSKRRIYLVLIGASLIANLVVVNTGSLQVAAVALMVDYAMKVVLAELSLQSHEEGKWVSVGE